MYGYPGSNSGASKGAGNLVVRFASEAIAQASSSVAAMVIVTPRLKGSVLKLGRVSSSESLCRISDSLVICHCLKSGVLSDRLHVNSLMRRNSANAKQNDACHVAP